MARKTRRSVGLISRGWKRGYVFVSYAREDQPAVQRLAKEIEFAGYRVRFDRTILEAGVRWHDTLPKAIGGADAVLWIISPASAKSKMVRREIQYAKKNQIRVIPVILKPARLPAELSRLANELERVFLRKDLRKAIPHVVEALGGIRGAMATLLGDRDHPTCRENGTLVAEVIRFLQNVKPNGGHAILRGGPNSAFRIQLTVMRRRTVRGEVDSDPHSKSKYRLDEGQCGALQKCGWKLPAGQTSGNYQQDWPAESVLRRALIARQVIRTFIEVFRHLPDEKLKFEF